MDISLSLNNRSLGLKAPGGVIGGTVLPRDCCVEEAAKAHISVKAAKILVRRHAHMSVMSCGDIRHRVLHWLTKLLVLLLHLRILLHFEHVLVLLLLALLLMSQFSHHLCIVEGH